MNGSACEFVPRSAQSFPTLPQSAAALRRAAARALEKQKQQDQQQQHQQQQQQSFSDAAQKAPAAPPPPPDSLTILTLEQTDKTVDAPRPILAVPAVPAVPVLSSPTLLFQSTASEYTVSKWKSKWQAAARVAFEKAAKAATATTAASASASSSSPFSSGGATSSSTWHGVLAPCSDNLWVNTESWKFSKNNLRQLNNPPAEEAKSTAAGHSKAQQRAHLVTNVDCDSAPNEATFAAWWTALQSEDMQTALALLRTHLDDKLTCPLLEHECLTSIMFCAKLGRGQMLQLLLDNATRSSSNAHSYNIDARERRSKKTALLIAIEHGQIECARLLIRAGASLECKDRASETALHKAARSGSASIVSWLCSLDRQSRLLRINAKNKRSETPLLLATHRDVASVLMDAGASPAATNSEGQTILMLAAGAGNHRLLECALMRPGSAIDGKDNSGNNALLLASKCAQRNASLACVRVLLAAQCDVNAVSSDGFSALMHAAQQGKREMLHMMLLSGAKTDIEDAFGANAFILSCLAGHFQVSLDLLFHGCPLTFAGLRRLLPAQASQIERMFEDPAGYFGGSAEVIFPSQEETKEEKWVSPLQLRFMGAPSFNSTVTNIASVTGPIERKILRPDLGPPDLRIVLTAASTGDTRDDQADDSPLVIHAHRVILEAQSGKLEALIAFEERQHAATSPADVAAAPTADDAVQEIRLSDLTRIRRRSFVRLISYIYSGEGLEAVLLQDSTVSDDAKASEEEQEENLLDLLELSDEFLVSPLKVELECLLLKRLTKSAPSFPHSGVYLSAACALSGLPTLRAASAFALLRCIGFTASSRNNGSGRSEDADERAQANDALLAITSLEL